jgi:hypothetical protein
VHDSVIHFSLSTSCSTTLSSNRAFASSQFIAPRHDETEKEASHALLQPVDYRKYMLEGQISQPLLGLGVEMTASLMNQVLRNLRHSVGDGTVMDTRPADYALQRYNDPVPVPSVFVLEQATIRDNLRNLNGSTALTVMLHTSHSYNLLITQQFVYRVLHTEEPLLPLPEEFIAQYPSEFPRFTLFNNEGLV